MIVTDDNNRTISGFTDGASSPEAVGLFLSYFLSLI
jgi:hypothetical protein